MAAQTNQVPGGFYFNRKTWVLHAIEGESGILADYSDCVKLNLLVVIPLALVLSFAFVVFLPTIGLALAGYAVWLKLVKR
jgi:succinate dehydrogenase hydrophobic anchor subunit